MRQREKVARTKKFALVAYAAIFLAIAYFTMSSIVGLFLASANNKYETIQLIHQLLTIIINSKYSPSIELWELIEPLPFGTGDPLSFLKALAPPLIIFIVSSLIIGSYRTAKKRTSQYASCHS